jgi:hypothetical protein
MYSELTEIFIYVSYMSIIKLKIIVSVTGSWRIVHHVISQAGSNAFLPHPNVWGRRKRIDLCF